MELLNLNTLTQANSSVYLIDENLCLADSVQILNHNFKIWQQQIDEFDSKISLAFNAIGEILNESTEWATFLTLLDSMQDSMENSFKVVDTINKGRKPISRTYPVHVPRTEWTPPIKKYYFYNSAIGWLNNWFPLANFPLSQIIKVNFLFQQTKDFRVSYEANYLENCIATPTNSIECAQGPGLYVGCNHYGGLAGESQSCTNAYEPGGASAHYCTSEYISVAPNNNCWSTDPFLLTTEYSYYGTEVITTKMVIVEFILQETGWELQKIHNQINA